MTDGTAPLSARPSKASLPHLRGRVALSLRLDNADGRMTGYITMFLSEEWLRRILAEQAISAGWTKGLYDRKLERPTESFVRFAPAALALAEVPNVPGS